MDSPNQTDFTMLRSRIISPTECERFITFNQVNAGAAVEPSYLEHATCRVFYHGHEPDHWLALYAINTQAPYRCLCVFDATQQVTYLQQHQLDPEQIAEITLLCRDQQYRWHRFEHEQYYLMSILDALRTGRMTILGATANPKLVGKLKILLNTVLYEGEINFFGQIRQGWVLYTSRWQIGGNLARYVGQMLLSLLL